MKKLAQCAAGIGAAVVMAVVGAAQASADAPDVTGEAYGKAVAILKMQGYKAIFGGSIGSDLPQQQCLVIEQSSMSNGSERLRLDCNVAYGEDIPDAPNTHSLVPPGGSVGGGGQRPTPGAGTVTVTPRPVA